MVGLAQVAQGITEQPSGAKLALAVLAGVAIVERVISFAGSLKLFAKVPSTAWPVIAVIVGVGFALGWQVNLAVQAFALVPALAGSSRFAGIAGQVLTGLTIGALAGPLHELVDVMRGKAGKTVGVTKTDPAPGGGVARLPA